MCSIADNNLFLFILCLSKPLKLCCRILVADEYDNSNGTPWTPFTALLSFVVGFFCVCAWGCVLAMVVFVGVFCCFFWFVLLEADGMAPGTGMQSRLLGVGKARKVQTVGTKAKNGDELLSRGCGMVKILADKKLFLSSREISPMQWKPLPSTGTAEDEPCSATGVCDQTPQTCWHWLYLQSKSLRTWCFRNCKGNRDLNLKRHLLLTSAMPFSCLPTSHLVQHCKG